MDGAVFHGIDRFRARRSTAFDGQSVNAILKKRCALAGLDPSRFLAHGLRSGYLTEAPRCGVHIQEAVKQSRHRSVQQAAAYHKEAEIGRGALARLG